MPARYKPDTFLEEMDQLPPFKCWLLARRGHGHPVSQEEIARLTGWSLLKVQRFCGLKTWAHIHVIEVDAFRRACGITRHNEYRHRYYLKRTLDHAQTEHSLAHVRKRSSSVQRRLIRLALNGHARTPALPAVATPILAA